MARAAQGGACRAFRAESPIRGRGGRGQQLRAAGAGSRLPTGPPADSSSEAPVADPGVGGVLARRNEASSRQSVPAPTGTSSPGAQPRVGVDSDQARSTPRTKRPLSHGHRPRRPRPAPPTKALFSTCWPEGESAEGASPLSRSEAIPVGVRASWTFRDRMMFSHTTAGSKKVKWNPCGIRSPQSVTVQSSIASGSVLSGSPSRTDRAAGWT